MDIMQEIRRRTQSEVFDYLHLLDCLSQYKSPRDKITKLLKSQSIIRVKKGLYIFGEKYRKQPYSLELVSNLIYGPSYVSFESALSYYGLIPEAVKRVTCASFKKGKLFETPIGDFIYCRVPERAFPLGMATVENELGDQFFMASKEKALVDYLARLACFETKEELSNYLVEGMRIDSSDLFSLQKPSIKEMKTYYKNTNVTLLWKILAE